MPKPNKKRIEARQDPNNRLKGAGKIYIPEGLTSKTIDTAHINAETVPIGTISDEELERMLRNFLKNKKSE